MSQIDRLIANRDKAEKMIAESKTPHEQIKWIKKYNKVLYKIKRHAKEQEGR